MREVWAEMILNQRYFNLLTCLPFVLFLTDLAALCYQFNQIGSIHSQATLATKLEMDGFNGLADFHSIICSL
jgi:hypothetical protein